MAYTTRPEHAFTKCPSIRNSTSNVSNGPVTFGVEVEAILAFSQERLQSVLDRYYNSTPVIVKTFPDRAHDCLLQEDDLSHQCRNLYPSWILQVPTEPSSDPSLQVVGQHSTCITGREGKVRRYLAEPLIIAKEAIESSGIVVDVKAQLRRNARKLLLDQRQTNNQIVLRAPSADYQTWTLTTDHTLIGRLEQQLYQSLGHRAFKHRTTTDPDGATVTIHEKTWDSSGFELVSPVFNYAEKKSAFASISTCLNTLSDETNHKILSSAWASLQVHIGLDAKTSWDATLPTLQHLAYILICHEDLLSRLHPRNRCGLSLKPQRQLKQSFSGETLCEELINSHSKEDEQQIDDFGKLSYSFVNDFDLDAPLPPEPTAAQIAAEDEAYLRQNEERVLSTEANYTGFGTTNSNARYFCHITSSDYPPTPDHVASYIFDPKITLPQLISFLQKPSSNPGDAAKGHRHRGYMYNFDNILTLYLQDTDVWKTGKPTIEFRQHACSTDPEEIRRWVEFNFALVKFAQAMAEKDNNTQGNGLTTITWEKQAMKYGQWPCKDIESLLGAECLGLVEEDIVYWIERFEMYRGDRPAEEEIDQAAI